MKTLEKPPTPKQSAPKPQTPGLEAHTKLYPIPPSGFPSRERIQREVKSAERQEAEEILAAFSEAKELSDTHDIAALSERIKSCETEGRHWSHIEAQRLRGQRDKCQHEIWEDCQIELRQLRVHAMRINLAVLRRSLASLESEIVNTALETEARLTAAGLPIFEDIPAAGISLIAPWTARPGFERRWTLLSDNMLTMLRSRRDCVQHKLNVLSRYPSGCDEAHAEIGVHTLRFFCTDEPGVGYDWL